MFMQLGELTKGRIEIFSTQINDRGGKVIQTKSYSQLFANQLQRKPFDTSVTHLIVSNSLLKENDICTNLAITLPPDGGIPDTVKVIHSEWLVKSLSDKALADETEYLLEFRRPERGNVLLETDTISGKKRCKDEVSSGFGGSADDDEHQPIKQTRRVRSIVRSDDTQRGDWVKTDQVMYKYYGYSVSVGTCSPKKIVAFDMDGTVISTKSGKTFAIDEHDWKLFHHSVPAKFKELHKEGVHLALISNQSGIKNIYRMWRVSIHRKYFIYS